MRSVVWPQVRGLQRVFSLGSGIQALKRISSLGHKGRGINSNFISSQSGNTPVNLRPFSASRAADSMRLVFRVSTVVVCIALAGCGQTYRPVVTPVNPTGPAPQPESFLIVTTTTGSDTPGLANVFDGSGDTLLTQAQLNNGPLAATLNATGSPATTVNTDGTVNTYTPSTTLRTDVVESSALISSPSQPALPFNLISTLDNLFIALPRAKVPAAAVMSNSTGVYQLVQELPLAASPVNFAGTANAQRIYAISQDNGSNKVAFGNCDNPSQVTTPGQVASIETSTLTISRTLPVGICPIYGVGSTDNLRTFILNRGSGTVTVINSQYNELDATPNRQNLNPANGTLTLPAPAGYTGGTFNAGPVYADYYAPTSQLVTANYDSNTISIVNVSLDVFGNDSPIFGQTVTIPVGKGPTALTILHDGSRVYVANQKDSTVSVVNLTTFQVEATIPVTGHPIAIASIFSTPYGQVFVIPSDQPYMSVIRTDTDQVNAAVQLDGIGVDVRGSTQIAGATSVAGTSNSANNVSHACGSGAPCEYLPPNVTIP